MATEAHLLTAAVDLLLVAAAALGLRLKASERKQLTLG
jgi:hypothetical protein